ncbi:MAG: phosphatase PAP2 family protein [Saprospiraceae bacterium]
MKYIWKNDWFFVPVAMFFGFCGVLAMTVPYSHELLFFNDLRYEPFNSIFRFLTQWGEAWAFVVFGLALLFWRPRYAMVIALVGFLVLTVGYMLKDAIGVDRPITYFEKTGAAEQIKLVPSLPMNRGQTSFPSGHTTAAFALYSLLSLMLVQRRKYWGLVFALMAILVGISRIFLVQHFLIDVLAGAFLGLLLSGLVWRAAAMYLPMGETGTWPWKK